MMGETIHYIKPVPRRMLSLKEAAQYCGVPESRFMAYCRVSPVDFGNGRRCYDLHDLDKWIDEFKSGLNAGEDDPLSRYDAP